MIIGHSDHLSGLGDQEQWITQVIATISCIEDVHGLLTIPELGRVYATATGANQVVAIDAKA